MKLIKEATEPRRSWLPSGVVALARRTFMHMGLMLTGPPRSTQHTAPSPGTARRGNAPPFADTEAGWHHL